MPVIHSRQLSAPTLLGGVAIGALLGFLAGWEGRLMLSPSQQQEDGHSSPTSISGTAVDPRVQDLELKLSAEKEQAESIRRLLDVYRQGSTKVPAEPLPPAGGEASHAVSPFPQATPSAVEDLQRQAFDRSIRQQVGDAKARYEALEAAAQQECPDLKPGELRLPEAINQCVALRAETRIAQALYQKLREQALKAGVLVQ